MDILVNGAAWVILTFEDGTKQCIFTTLCHDIFKQRGIEPKKGSFYDLEHNRYVPYRKDAVDVSVSRDKPVFGSEVLDFASRYI